jgi:hypothetical protein
MNLPNIADRFKRSIISETAMRLAATHGRRKMYSSAEVVEAMGKANFPAGWAGWGVAVFCTNAEFADYCAAQGLTADYNNTRLDALRFLDRPQPKAAAPLAAAGAALGAGAAAASTSLTNDEAELLVDAAEVAVDVVGGIFDVLDIF